MATTGKWRQFLIVLLSVLLVFSILAPVGSAEIITVKSPLGYCLAGTSTDMFPGKSGTTTTNSGALLSRWAMDEDGYFTISIENPGTYQFNFYKDSSTSITNNTFGVTLVGAGGGGGGSMISPDSVGQGGCGGDVEVYPWQPDVSGYKISSFLSPVSVSVGSGGVGGSGFQVCMCNGSKCPIGAPSAIPWATHGKGNNKGTQGTDTIFSNLIASGGNGGEGGTTTGGLGSKAKASGGSNGKNCGQYIFWGVVYNCGYGGYGGEFGGHDGIPGDPTYYHDHENSFGKSGETHGGKGNGGGGGGFIYSFGHPQISGTGTGEGMGSYSHTMQGTAPGGGPSTTSNGYIYIEGKVNVEDSPVIERYQLAAKVSPDNISPIPEISWASSNVKTAKISPTGTVLIFDRGTAVITATAKNGVQGNYLVDSSTGTTEIDDILFNIVSDGVLENVGDTAKLSAEFVVSGEQSAVTWSSSNPHVATVSPATGEVQVVGSGVTVISALLADGTEKFYVLPIGSTANTGGTQMISLHADKTKVEPGESVTIKANTFPASNNVSWYVSSGIASLDTSTKQVKFTGEGIVTVTATCGTVSDSWTFVCEEKPELEPLAW